jgi:hypothetical protein
VSRGPDRLNRTVLTLLAVALLAAGAYGLARGYGAFGDARAAEPILDDDVRSFVTRNADWFWPLAAVCSILAAWIGLRWLLAQFVTPSVTHLPVRADGPGRTELSVHGATAALAREIGEYAGVRSSKARMVSDHPPEVEITVDVHDDADVPAVRRRIEEHALPRFRTALELPNLQARIHVRLAEPAGRTVH